MSRIALRFLLQRSSRDPQISGGAPRVLRPAGTERRLPVSLCLLVRAQAVLSRSDEDNGFLRNAFLSVLIALALFILERL